MSIGRRLGHEADLQATSSVPNANIDRRVFEPSAIAIHAESARVSMKMANLRCFIECEVAISLDPIDGDPHL